ncbi:YrhK family protein [Stakelama marina]|uniref:YrhK family protein n=1 Tax=Stakelama marina TaxID=2826939 RepID=A0A8T4IH68_9SPHN|nr:YrhK family protein [Stakelama marina]MBR0553382.1 YrhK family protein [Stakelama marina]
MKTLIRDYPYIHLAIGLLGNLCFLVGSVLFFKQFEAWHTTAVWLFVAGSAGMLLGALGKAATDIINARENRNR